MDIARKTFGLTLEVRHFYIKFKYRFEFGELTLRELIQAEYEAKNIGFQFWLLEYLQSKQVRKWYQPKFTSRTMSKLGARYIEEVFNYIYSKSDIDIKDTSEGNMTASTPLSFTIVTLMRECGKLSLNDIMDMTKSEINFLAEGLEYSINSQTKEGKIKNKIADGRRVAKERLERDKDQIEAVKQNMGSSLEYIKNLKK